MPDLQTQQAAQVAAAAATQVPVPSLEAAFHWLIGIVMTVLSTAATWAVRSIVRHDRELALVQSAIKQQDDRHEETLAMLAEIRTGVNVLRDRNPHPAHPPIDPTR